jgi:hypothetical protein
VTYRLKARSAEREETAVAKQGLGKQVSSARNNQAKIEELLEAMFSMWSVPRLYKGD